MAGAALELRVMGELSVVRDGKTLALPQSKKTRALLGYLALSPGAHRRERLCALFWEVPDDPRGALRWSLSKLRPLVDDPGRERIVADRDRVSFDAGGVEIDYYGLERAVKAGLDRLSTEDLAALADAARGPLLDGLDLPHQPEFAAWRLAMQERAKELQAAALKALIAKLPATGADRLTRYGELVQLVPHDIDAQTGFVAALAQAGRKADAERQAAQARAALFGADGFAEKQLDAALNPRPGPPPTAPAAPADLSQEIRFCRADDGVRIAYSSVGDGPPLVKTANWLNHLEFDWESPVWRHVFRALAGKFRLVRYDERGNGLSDWEAEDLSFEAMVRDLEAVVDACGLEKFPLFAISQGCAVAIEYAARHPDRVTRMILFGGYPRGWRINATEKMIEQTEAMLTLMRVGWGQDNPAFREMFTSFFMPDAPPENKRWFNELQRMTTAPEHAVRLMRAFGDVDVRARLAEIKTPTLVVHCRDDARISYALGRELAAGIPDARFVTLESRNHLLPESDPAWPVLLREIMTFLDEGAASP